MTSLSLLYAHSVRPIPGKGRSSNPCPQLKAPVGQSLTDSHALLLHREDPSETGE